MAGHGTALLRWGHSQHPALVRCATPARAPKAPSLSSLCLPPAAWGYAAGARPQGRRLRTSTPEGFSCTKAVSCLIKSRPAVMSLPAHQRGSGSSAAAKAGTQPCYGTGTHDGPGTGSQGRVTLLLPASSPFVSSQPPGETACLQPSLLLLAPRQKSSLKLSLERGLRWVLPPSAGSHAILGLSAPLSLPSRASTVTASKRVCPARETSSEVPRAAALCFGSSGTGMARTTLDVGAPGCLTRAFARMPCVLLAGFGC